MMLFWKQCRKFLNAEKSKIETKEGVNDASDENGSRGTKRGAEKTGRTNGRKEKKD